MAALLVVSHSQTGATERLVEAFLAGARHPDIDDVDVSVVDALDGSVADVEHCDLVVLATPENFGYMSGALKVFLDRTYHPLLEAGVRRPYQLLVRAGNDGQGAVAAVERIISGLDWTAVRPPLVASGPLTDAHLTDAETLGMEVAASLSLGLV